MNVQFRAKLVYVRFHEAGRRGNLRRCHMDFINLIPGKLEI